MLMLVLGKGKTGSLVAQVARERGHSVRVLDWKENAGAGALTAPTLATIDVVVDFTNPQSALENMRSCLALGARIVVGTTGWYDKLPDMKALAHRKGGALLYGSNFSLGVQKFFQLTAQLARLKEYSFAITETHHASKLDSPSGTALSLRDILLEAHPEAQIDITAHRVGEVSGIHVVAARSQSDLIELRHEAFDRRGFALGAVLAAEWIVGKSGTWEFREVAPQIMAGQL